MNNIYNRKGIIVDKHIKNPGRRYVKKSIQDGSLPNYCI